MEGVGEMNASFNRVITSEPFYHKLNIQLITLYKLFGLTVDSHDMTSTPLEDFLWVYLYWISTDVSSVTVDLSTQGENRGSIVVFVLQRTWSINDI